MKRGGEEKRNRLEVPVTEARDGLEIRQILKNELGFSAARLRSVKFDPQGILLDGRRVTVRERVHTGQQLSVLLEDSGNRRELLLPTEMPLEILYEDKNLLFVNKPAGMVCHPSQGHYADSLANGVRNYLDHHGGGSVHLAGRLDKDASGVVCVARNGLTAERLRKEKESSGFRKVYLAIAAGSVRERTGVIRIPLEIAEGEDGLLRAVEGTGETGLPAETHWEVLGEGAGWTLLRVTIGTGRMHQIRFHLSAVGHPLLSDPLYGEVSPLIGRTALHAAAMYCRHPFTGRALCVEAPLPPDFSVFVKGYTSDGYSRG